MRRFVSFVIVLLAGAPLAADDLSKFSVHGYLNQAYAVSEDYPILGIPTQGTTEYRDLALQFRYDPNRRNAVVMQLRHQRFGESTPGDAKTVDVDWAFYQRNFTDRFSVKAGRIPLPLGIFNEAGGAATTSPFFRPAHEFYDRHYTSKTVEGVLGSLSLGDPAGWSFDIDGYAGRWRLDQWFSENRADAKNALGGQVWVNTPVQGVRFGAGAYRCEVDPPQGARVDYLMVHASVDADFDRWRFAGEYLSGNLAMYGRYRAGYAQAGLQVTRRISVHARGALARVDLPPSNGHSLESRLSDDIGLSVNYAAHPRLLLKLEGHSNDGLLREDVPFNFYNPPSRTRYFIASVVASF